VESPVRAGTSAGDLSRGIAHVAKVRIATFESESKPVTSDRRQSSHKAKLDVLDEVYALDELCFFDVFGSSLYGDYLPDTGARCEPESVSALKCPEFQNASASVDVLKKVSDARVGRIVQGSSVRLTANPVFCDPRLASLEFRPELFWWEGRLLGSRRDFTSERRRQSLGRNSFGLESKRYHTE
jgi:hypothetical protein